MTNYQPTEILGDTINAWDDFYQNHYDWVYQYSLKSCQNTLKAKELTDKIFVKLLLSNPEYIIDNNEKAFKSELGILFPYYGMDISEKFRTDAIGLLKMYYQPN